MVIDLRERHLSHPRIAMPRSATTTTPEPHVRGGHTNAVNGLGECERCNYAKEASGWTGHNTTIR